MDRSRPIKTDPIAAVFRRLKNDELNATVLTLDAELAPASESGRQAAPAEPLARRSTCAANQFLKGGKCTKCPTGRQTPPAGSLGYTWQSRVEGRCKTVVSAFVIATEAGTANRKTADNTYTLTDCKKRCSVFGSNAASRDAFVEDSRWIGPECKEYDREQNNCAAESPNDIAVVEKASTPGHIQKSECAGIKWFEMETKQMFTGDVTTASTCGICSDSAKCMKGKKLCPETGTMRGSRAPSFTRVWQTWPRQRIIA